MLLPTGSFVVFINNIIVVNIGYEEDIRLSKIVFTPKEGCIHLEP